LTRHRADANERPGVRDNGGQCPPDARIFRGGETNRRRAMRMSRNTTLVTMIAMTIALCSSAPAARAAPAPAAPSATRDALEPNEIPVPPIPTALGTMPGVNELPDRPQMPD